MVRVCVCLALLLVAPIHVSAQTAPVGPLPERGWLDINFLSLHSAQGEQAYTYQDTIFLETRTFAAAYLKLPSAKGPGIDVGFHLTPRFAAGIYVASASYEYRPGLAVRVPHPTVANRFAEDADATLETLERKDRAVDVSVIYVPRMPDKFRVRLFGGPTYLSVEQDMVQNILYDQVFTLGGFNSVDIDEYEAETVDGSAWGVHAGVDVAYFFHRNVGVGGVVRFNRGSVEIDEPLSEDDEDLKAGFTTVGVGLRLRF